MENEDTEYKSGDHDSFIKFVFDGEPKSEKTIKLELDPPGENN